MGLAAGLFASILKDGTEVVLAAGRPRAAARAVKASPQLSGNVHNVDSVKGMVCVVFTDSTPACDP